jgi:PAS domain S-box-containing protein
MQGPLEWLNSVFEWLGSVARYTPADFSRYWRTDVVALHVQADALAAIGYFVIAGAIVWVLRQRADLSTWYRRLSYLVVLLLLSTGVVHAMAAVGHWYPSYGVHALVKIGVALLLVLMVALALPAMPKLARLPSPRQLAEANEGLLREAAAHETTLKELRAIRRELELRVAERTRELSQVKARFETALRGAKIYVFSQDRELRYLWVYNPSGEDASASIIGRTDSEILLAPDREIIIAAKMKVLETGEPQDIEAAYMMPEGRVIFALHIEPTFGPDNSIDGVRCAAVDVTRIRNLEREQRHLMEQLGTTLQRYEIAMQGSNVTVFTQDRDLRYTNISKPMFGLAIDQIVGRTDEEIAPEADRAGLIALKREVLASGEVKNQEFRFTDGVADRWFQFHIEPLRDVAGAIVGLTCSAIDVTERKQTEAHLRLLMHELTHRSKNLLAVIQAMANQTGRHAGSVSRFLQQFGERLQALARSHDLLVQEDWHGASLGELVRSQLGHYLDDTGQQIAIEGPPLRLKPEAAQSLGLALHELATNAMKYGALSVPTGRVSISWTRRPETEGGGLEIQWVEGGGPAVEEPRKRGFGSLVINRNLTRSLDAEVEYAFAQDGVRCRIIIPEAHFSAVDKAGGTRSARAKVSGT